MGIFFDTHCTRKLARSTLYRGRGLIVSICMEVYRELKNLFPTLPLLINIKKKNGEIILLMILAVAVVQHKIRRNGWAR